MIALVGLGRMGANMARRLARAGTVVHGCDPMASARAALEDETNVTLHSDLEALVDTLVQPRTVWLMLPAGEVTDQTLTALTTQLAPGDLIIDGGNANYLDTQQRAARFAALGIDYADCGVSGGVWGLQNGYCLMVGGSKEALTRISPVLKVLAPAADRGWLHCGPVGAGHFTKMVHNGIEYGMMQAYAEGFALLAGKDDMHIPVAAVAELWRHGSVVQSWLLDLTADALTDPAQLDLVAPVVADSGEGRWTIAESMRQGTPTPVIAAAMMARFDSQGRADLANKLLALMRKGFGGHAVAKKNHDQSNDQK